MKPVNEFFNVLLKGILVGTILVFAIFLFRNYLNSQPSDAPKVPPLIITPAGPPLIISATQMAQAGNPVPTEEFVYIKAGDIPGLQIYLDSQAKNWLNPSMNIHSGNVYGVGVSSETVKTTVCDWPSNPINEAAKKLFCRYVKIEYTSVYKGMITAGTTSDFVLHPTITLGEDWTEVKRTTVGNRTEIVMAATVTVTYSGDMCVTSVEESTPSSVHDGDTPPTDKSYTIKSLDERRLWPDLGPWLFPSGINEEYLRLDSYKKAKDVALLPEKVNTLYGFVEGDLRPGGTFYNDVASFYTPQLAQMYGIRGFNIVMSPTRSDPRVRCDGTYVNK